MSWTISEEEIEGQLADNPGPVVGHPHALTFARQLTLPSGRRLDLLVAHPVNSYPADSVSGVQLTVVEVKSVTAGLAALTQLVGYVEELEGWRQDAVPAESNQIPPIRGVVAAPGIEDEVRSLANYMPRITTNRLDVRVECLSPPYDAPWGPWHDRLVRQLPQRGSTRFDDFRQEMGALWASIHNSWRGYRARRKRERAVVPVDQSPESILMAALRNGDG